VKLGKMHLNRRAFLFTILTYTLIASTFAVGYFYHQKGREGDLGPIKALEKVSALKADVASDLSDIYGLDIRLEDGKLLLNDSYRTGIQNNLNNYESYLEGDYADDLRSTISLGTLGFSFTLWPQNLTYEYTDDVKSAIQIYCANSEIEAYNIGIDVTNEASLDSTTNDTSVGSFPLVLSVRNSGGASVLNVDSALEPTYCNQYIANFTSGNSVTVEFGACSGLTRALIVSRSGTHLETDVEVTTLASNQTQFMADSLLTIEAVRNVTSSEQVVMSRI